MKKLALAAAVAAGLTGGMTAPAFAEGQTHYLAIHVDENDPKVMNLALNNAANVSNYYAAQGDEAVIEIVAYGPGLNMLVPGKSPVADRISAMSLQYDGKLTFSACGNTIKNMSKKLGHQVTVMPEAVVVPAGVVRLMELQEEGYSYLRP